MVKRKKLNLYSSIFSILSVLILVNEMDIINNYESKNIFFTLFISVGLALAIGILFFMKKVSLIFIENSKEGNSIAIWIAIGTIAFTLSVASKSNRWLANKKSICNETQVIEKEVTKPYRSNKYFITVNLKNKMKKVEISEKEWNNYSQNETINICENTGFFGFKYSELENK